MIVVNPMRRACITLLLALSVPAGSAPAAPAGDGDDRLAPAQVREDFELALAAVEAGLPRITWFQSARQWRDGKRQARRALADVHDRDALFRVLRPLFSRIGEGHLMLFRSEAMTARDRRSSGWLPLDLHWNESAVHVVAGYGEAADIAAGTRLLAIDGEAVDALVPELMAALGHDGIIRTGAMREADGGGYARVRYWLRGPQVSFQLSLQHADGRIETRRVAAVDAAQRPARAISEPSPIATLRWPRHDTAVLHVPTFSNRRYRAAGADYRTVLRQCFETLQARGAQRLILDLRDNGGGSESNENLLFAHLVAAPMRKYERVEARAAALSVTDASGRRYTTEVYDEDELQRQRRMANGRLHRRNLPPDGLMSHWSSATPVFGGRLAVLIGGNTFSGAAELAAMLRHRGRGVFIGEETGGAGAGNTSGYTWDITLPNSGLRLEVPLLRFVFAWRAQLPARGVLPHCEVVPERADPARPDAALKVALALLSRPLNGDRVPECPRRSGFHREPATP